MNIQMHPQPRTVSGGAAVAPEQLIPGFARPGDDADWAQWAAAFEDAYASAGGDVAQVPWCRDASHAPAADPALIEWLDSHAPSLLRPGACVSVVGCGTGDNAAELAARGYDIAAFDIAPTAISWAQRRFPHIADCFFHADLLADRQSGAPAPTRLLRRADLVVEDETLTWLPPAMLEKAVRAITSLARPRGIVLIIGAVGDGHAAGDPHTPPFAIDPDQLVSLMAAQGMTPLMPIAQCTIHSGDLQRLCAAFRRA